MSKDKKKCDGGLIALWVFIGVLTASLISLVLALCVFNHQISIGNYTIGSSKTEKKKTSNTTSSQTTEEGWVVVSSTKLLSKMAQQESFLLYVGKDSCPACQNFNSLLRAAGDEVNEPEIFYYNTEKAKHKKTVLRTLDVEDVPSLVFIKKGIVFDRADNTTDQVAIKTFLEKYKE